MLFGKFVPAIPGQTLLDPKADYRTAEKFGTCRVSKAALYLPDGKYLPLNAIADVVVGFGCAHVTGCCAGGVMVPRVVVVAADGAKYPLMCNTEAISQQLAAALKGENP